jgi:hypothetical protein
MTKPSFPANPSDNAPYTSGGITYTWNNTLGVWSAEVSGGGGGGGLEEPITFKEITTHEDGVSVTGGGAGTVNTGIYETASGGIKYLNLASNNSEGIQVGTFLNNSDRQVVNINGQAKINHLCLGPAVKGNVGASLSTVPTLEKDTAIAQYGGYVFSDELCAFTGFSSGDLTTFAGAISTVTTSSDVYNIGASFYTATSADTTHNNRYGFYAAGNAPSKFNGNVLINAEVSQNFASPTAGLKIFTGSNAVSNSRLEIKGRWRDDGGYNLGISFTSETSSTDDTPVSRGSIRIYNDKIGIAGLAGGPLMIDEGADARLVTTTEAITNASTVVQQLQPVKINGTRHGFTAAALEPVFVEAVAGPAGATEAVGTLLDWDGTELETEVTEPDELEYTEEVETDGVTTMVTRTRTWTATGTRPVYQGVDQTKLIPLLTKALQEALERIEVLEAAAAKS